MESARSAGHISMKRKFSQQIIQKFSNIEFCENPFSGSPAIQ
jgi:hypothetical protein